MRIIPVDKMTFVFFNLAPGSIVPEHSHPHEQIGTVLKGSVDRGECAAQKGLGFK